MLQLRKTIILPDPSVDAMPQKLWMWIEGGFPTARRETEKIDWEVRGLGCHAAFSPAETPPLLKAGIRRILDAASAPTKKGAEQWQYSVENGRAHTSSRRRSRLHRQMSVKMRTVGSETWLCPSCGNSGCGSDANGHAQAHFPATRAMTHEVHWPSNGEPATITDGVAWTGADNGI